jgi:nicotinamidase-related amidase
MHSANPFIPHINDAPGMREPILVIVDMQPEFEASSNAETLSEIRKLISFFKHNYFPIIVLEYGNPDIIKPPSYRLYCGTTHEQLMSLLLYPQRYCKLVVVEKYCNDGSAFVLETCAEREFSQAHFVLCGVNTDACVSATAHGLAVRRRSSKVSVIAAACHTPASNFSWSNFPQRANIVIVHKEQAA